MALDKKAASEKQAALESAIKQIEKKFGAGAIMQMGTNQHLKVDAISTGSLTLDIATGIGGLPKGRIVEIYGPESSGKTTLALHCVAEAQKDETTNIEDTAKTAASKIPITCFFVFFFILITPLL